MKFLGVTVSGVVAAEIFPQKVEAREIELKKEPEQFSYIDTAKESSLVTLASIVGGGIFQRLSMPIRNARSDESKEYFMDTSIAEFMIKGGILGPFAEEALFRLLPSAVTDRVMGKGTQWGLGIMTSTIFAMLHKYKINIAINGYEGLNIEAENAAPGQFPLVQFLQGMYFWKMIRERNYLHSVLAHSVINNEVFILAKLLLRLGGHFR